MGPAIISLVSTIRPIVGTHLDVDTITAIPQMESMIAPVVGLL